jgi:hypothetical protein
MTDPLTGAIAIGVVGVLLALGGELVIRRRKRAFREHYGDYEGFRTTVDAAMVRTVRGARGDVAAIKAVRESHPEVSLTHAKRYVQEL